jgi:hypothetical protein
MHEEETSHLGDGGDSSMWAKSTVRMVALPVLLVCIFCGVPVNAAQTEIANDYVAIRFPDGLDVPREVQELLLERITESICYLEGFLEYTFPRQIQYEFVESTLLSIGTFGLPNIVRDSLPVPIDTEDPSLYKPFNPHEIIHLVNHDVWQDCVIASMDEGFAWLVSYLYLEFPLHYEASCLLALGELPPLEFLLIDHHQGSRFKYRVLARGNLSFLGFLYEKFGHRAIICLHKGLAEICGEGMVRDNVISLIEECTSTPLAEFEREWHSVLHATEVHPRYLTALMLHKEYDKADLLTLFHLCQYYNVEIDDPMFIAEVQSLESDIQNFVKDESLNEDDLRHRIEALREWATEMRRRMRGI